MSSPGNPSNSFIIQGGFVPSDDTSEGVSTVNVSVEDYTADDQAALLLDDEEGDPLAIWSDFRVINYYEIDMHRYMAGITSPNGFQGDTAAFFQLAGPTLLWLSRWTACRISKRPEIPDPPDIEDENWIMLDLEYEPHSIALLKDGITPIYRISGLFTFGYRKLSTTKGNVLDLMAFGRPPWIQDIPIRSVGGITKTPSLIDSSTGTGSSSVSPGNSGSSSQ